MPPQPSQRASGKRGPPPEQQPAHPDMLALQRGRFVKWQPSPVLCGAVTADGTVAAVGREDGQIELWDTLSWQLLRRIPGSSQAALSALAWVEEASEGEMLQRRLVAGGLDGTLTEWDTATLQPLASTDCFGGAVWALAVQPGPIPEGESPAVAVACDDGVLRLFGADGAAAGVHYRRSFGHVEGRVLSVAWHPSGRTLVSGHSDGCIRAWDAASTREIYRITACKEGCVWALTVLPDGTIVSGESSGRVHFWDGATGAMTADFHQHAADVLAVAASPDGRAVYAAGVDPCIAVFQLLPAAPGGGGRQAWSYQDLKRPHTHDVRMLLTLPSEEEAPLLLSGGNDAQLLAHSADEFMQHHPTRVCAIPERPLTALATLPAPQAQHQHPNGILNGSGADGDSSGSGCVLIVSATAAQLDLWRLPPATGDPQDHGVLADPVHLARIANKSGRHILTAAVSRDGSRIAFSDAFHTRVLNVEGTNSAVNGNHLGNHFGSNSNSNSQSVASSSVTFRRHPLPDGVPPAHLLCFGAAASELFAASADGTIAVVDLEDQKVVCRFPASARSATEESSGGGSQAARAALQPPLSALAVSPAGDLLAAAGAGAVHFFRLTAQPPNSAGRALLGSGAATALAWRADGSEVAVTTADAASRSVHILDVATRRPSAWTAQHGRALQRSLDKVPGAVQGISFSPQPGTASLLISTPHAFAHVDILRPMGGSSQQKRRRQAEYVKPEDAALLAARVDNFRAAKLRDPCLLMAFTGPGAAVLLEHDWAHVFAGLPAPMYRRRFGT